MYNEGDYKPPQTTGILIDLSDQNVLPPPTIEPLPTPIYVESQPKVEEYVRPSPTAPTPSWNQHASNIQYNRPPPIYPVYNNYTPPSTHLYPQIPEPTYQSPYQSSYQYKEPSKVYMEPKMPKYDPPKPPNTFYESVPYNSKSYKTPPPPVKNDDVYYDNPPYDNPPYDNKTKYDNGPYGSTIYNSPKSPYGNVGNPALINYDISEDSLFGMKGRQQIILIDDGHSNITDAYSNDDRSGQNVDACKMMVELNGVVNSKPIKFHLINAFYLDKDNVYHINDYNDWIKTLDWLASGTSPAVRLNAVLESYFLEWNKDSNLAPVTITYISDSKINDYDKMVACLVNAIRESETRGKPLQITFQIFQVGKDENTTKLLKQMETDLKIKYRLKSDSIGIYYGNMILMQKIKKAIVGEHLYNGPYDHTIQYGASSGYQDKGPY